MGVGELSISNTIVSLAFESKTMIQKKEKIKVNLICTSNYR